MPTSAPISTLISSPGRALFGLVDAYRSHEALAVSSCANATSNSTTPRRRRTSYKNIVETSPDPEQKRPTPNSASFWKRLCWAFLRSTVRVVMLRDVEELSTSETAAGARPQRRECEDLRLHRGHAMARGRLFQRVGANAKNAFPFMGVRCDRVVRVVFERLAELRSKPAQIQDIFLPSRIAGSAGPACDRAALAPSILRSTGAPPSRSSPLSGAPTTRWSCLTA